MPTNKVGFQVKDMWGSWRQTRLKWTMAGNGWVTFFANAERPHRNDPAGNSIEYTLTGAAPHNEPGATLTTTKVVMSPS